MFELVETSAPPVLPVPRTRLLQHLRLGEGFAEPSGEEALYDAYLAAATARVEAETGQALIRRGFRLTVSDWDPDGRLSLPVGPVATPPTAEIAGEAIGDLALEPGTTRQRLSRAGCALPPIPAGSVAVIAFEAGWGTVPEAVPDDLAQAVLLLAVHYHDARAPGGPPPGDLARAIARRRPVRI